MEKNTKTVPGGLVVIFEGIDGVGKTTQLKMAEESLSAAGWPVFTTRNMGGTPIGEAIREVLLSGLERPPLTDFYASLAIQEPLIEVIDRVRAEGKVILMDRGPLSLAAYQIYGAGVDSELGWKHVQAGLERIDPQAMILYDMQPEEALARIKGKSAESDYFESKPVGYFQKVADGFREAAGKYADMTVMDASLPVDEIHERTMRVINYALDRASAAGRQP